MRTKLILISVIVLFCVIPSRAQFTTVTAQVKDTSGNLYQNCHGEADFVPSPTATTQPFLSGSLFQTSVPINQCDGNANLTIVLADNNQVSDGHSNQVSQWRFTICSSGTPVQFSVCFNYTTTITGATQNISAGLQAVSAPLIQPGAAGILNGNNAWTGNETHSGTETFSGQIIFHNPALTTGVGVLADEFSQYSALVPNAGSLTLLDFSSHNTTTTTGGSGGGILYGLHVTTDSDAVDTSAGVAIQNNGKSDNLYLGVAGKSGVAASTPTGVGIDLNRAPGSSNENSTMNAGFGMQCFDWSQTDQGAGGPGCILLNKQSKSYTGHYLFRETNCDNACFHINSPQNTGFTANSPVFQVAQDSSGNFYFDVGNEGQTRWANGANAIGFSDNGTTAKWELFGASGNLTLNGIGTFNATPNAIVTSGAIAMGNNNINGLSALISNTANHATVGFLQMANTDRIHWRNAANTSDDTLGDIQAKTAVAGCTTANTLNATCTTTVTWDSPFADNNYIPICIGVGVSSGTPVLQGITSQLAASVTVQTINLSAVASQFSTVQCLGVHP
jgi:hypothetical protein